MKFRTVAVTGADTRTHIGDMVALSADYPNLEWGILLSSSSEGSPRFPTQRWMQSLLMQAPDIPCAGHLCGRYVRDLFPLHRRAGGFTFAAERSNIVPLFRRFQVNFHGIPLHGDFDEASFHDALRSMGTPVILQMDGVNDFRLETALAAGLDVQPLFDKSHGEGVVPEFWPYFPFASLSGYAGGLGPDNLADELKRIEDVVGDNVIWIDAETKLRNDADEFDIDYVSKFLKIAEPYFGEVER